MIGSISKVKPCGNSHHYKYAHAKDFNDIKQISPNYGDDDKNYIWDYPLSSLTSGNNLFTFYSNTTNYIKGSTIKKFYIDAPKSTTWQAAWRANTSAEEIYIYSEKGISLYLSVYNCTNLKVFEPYKGWQKATNISYMGERIGIKRFYGFNISGSNFNHSLLKFTGQNDNALQEINCDISVAVNATNAFAYNKDLRTLKYPIDEDGNCIFSSNKPQATNEQGELLYKYATLPKLSNGENMFLNCNLDKESALSILNSLPTWSDGNVHKFALGVNSSYGYDPDFNLALKKVCKNYITPLEKVGQPLIENVEEGKGWDLSISWAVADSSEAPSEYINSLLDYDSIQLPDGFTRCEYLEDTGSQYIKVPYPTSENTGLYIIAKSINSGNFIPMGCGQNTNNNTFNAPRWCLNYSSGYNWNGWNQWNSTGTGTIYVGSINYKNNNLAKLDTQGYNYNSTLAAFGATRPSSIHLFGTSYDGTAHSLPWNGRIYRAQITEGENIVMDFIPCLNVDGIPCMYDIIEGKEYTNEITTPFLYKIKES